MRILVLLICLIVNPCSLTEQKGLEALNSSSIYSVAQSSDGAIWLNTNFGVYRFNGHELSQKHEPLQRYRFRKSDGGLFLHSPGGGTVFRVDVSSGELRKDTTATVLPEVFQGYPWKDVRAVAEDRDGNEYIGTVEGLFRRTAAGEVSEIPILGTCGSPICDLMTDIDGNLWVGTFYDGVFYCNLSSNPFTHVDKAEAMHKMKGAVQTPDGCIWVVTDGYGMFRKAPGRDWTAVRGTEHIKFQCAFYDRPTGSIWAGEFAGSMLRFDITAGRLSRIPFSDGKGHSIATVCRIGEDLFLGGDGGVMILNPQKEDRISRSIPGIGGFVYDLATGPEGRLFVGSYDLYECSGSEIVHKYDMPSYSISDIEFDADGNLWAAGSSGGVLRILADGSVKSFTTDNSDLHDNCVIGIAPLSNGLVLACTRSGVEILDPVSGASSDFSTKGAFSAVSTDKATKLLTGDGRLMIVGSEGIEVLDGSRTGAGGGHSVTFDGISGDRLVIKPRERSFSLHLADYNYTGINTLHYSYQMEGMDRSWHSFDITRPLQFMNMKPGRYTLNVRGESGGEETCRTSLKVRILPKWHESTITWIIFALLAAASIFWFIRNSYARALMSEKLKMKERESEDKVRQFHDISLQLRTPVNLTLTELEQFFREHGSHTRGIETLDDVYARTKKMHGIIAGYVEDQENVESQVILKYERFLSAATGVVERNLFSENLNVTTLCDELNMGKSKLCETMKAASGMSPREFIEDIRLRHAEQMLESGTYRVGEVAERLGFSSAKYFSQRYNKKFGHSPKTKK